MMKNRITNESAQHIPGQAEGWSDRVQPFALVPPRPGPGHTNSQSCRPDKYADLDAAVRHLIEAAMIDKHFAEDLPRRAAVALLRLVGPDHPLDQEHRSRLAMAIHS